MTVGLMGLLVPIMLGLFVFHIWALVDALRTPTSVWTAAEQNQVLWVIVVLFLSVVGPILYLLIARPALQAVGGAGPVR